MPHSIYEYIQSFLCVCRRGLSLSLSLSLAGLWMQKCCMRPHVRAPRTCETAALAETDRRRMFFGVWCDGNSGGHGGYFLERRQTRKKKPERREISHINGCCSDTRLARIHTDRTQPSTRFILGSVGRLECDIVMCGRQWLTEHGAEPRFFFFLI